MTSKSEEKVLEKAKKGLPLKDILIIDCHGHLGAVNQFHIPWNDAPGMLKVMDNLGIDTICISAHASISSDYRLGNDLVRKAAKNYPGRFLGYIGINPHYPGEIEAELERCETPEVNLIKIHPVSHSYSANDSNYRAMWNWANQKECVVLSHTWGGDKYCDPLIFERLASDHPKVKIILGHSGANWEGLRHSVEVVRKRDNVYLDITMSFVYFGLVEYLDEKVGSDKILYGSDMPYIEASAGLGKVVYSRIKDEDKEKILGFNMKNLLRL